MTQLLKQARNLFCGLLLLASVASVAMAEVPDSSGPTGAGGEKPMGVSELMSSLGDAVSSIVTSGPDKDKAKPKAESDLEAIKAKHLDQDPADKADEKKKEEEAKPYKIYPSPTIIDDEPSYVDPYEAARGSQEASSPTAFTGWEGKEDKPVVDTKAPPALPAQVQESLAGLRKSIAQTNPTVPATIARVASVPPISALPKQFFPILPAGALQDTPPQLLPVASNQSLEANHTNVTRAIIVIHDIQRNAAEGVATLMTLSGVDGERTLIIAPQFPLELDILRFGSYLPNDGQYVARWPIAHGWQTGGDSVLPSSKRGVSSFTAVDLLLMLMADRTRFPALERVVLVGHGMGGDFLQRYAAVGQAPAFVSKGGLEVQFIVANPSSYLYLTALRPSLESPAFLTPDLKTCPQTNAYPYGLSALDNYARRVGGNEIRLRYPERKITYLIGDKIMSDPYLDGSCAAKAQGEDRLSRARNYERHVMQSFGATLDQTQRFVYVSHAGYDPVSLYGSSCGMAMLFGDGACELTNAGH